MSVPPTGVLQQVKMRITQIEENSPKACRVCSPAFAMLIIRAVILAPRIVKDGEEPYHLNNRSIAGGNFECVSLDPSPVAWPVNRIRIALKLSDDVIPKGIKIDLNNFSHKPYSTPPHNQVAWPWQLDPAYLGETGGFHPGDIRPRCN